MLHMKGPIAIKIQLQQDPHNPHKGHSRNTECRWTKETVPLGPIGHLLCKGTLPRHGVKAALPYTQKQTQGHCQNKKTNMAQMKEQEKSPEKELNEMEFARYTVQNNGYKDAQKT